MRFRKRWMPGSEGSGIRYCVTINIVWCVWKAALFAFGMVNGYFDGDVPLEFWKLFVLPNIGEVEKNEIVTNGIIRDIGDFIFVSDNPCNTKSYVCSMVCMGIIKEN